MIPLSIRNKYAQWSLRAMHTAGIRTVNQELLGGGRMILRTNDWVAQRIRCEEAFEPAVRREMERVAAQKVNVLDIGANIGYYTVLTARLIGPEHRVFAFEPQPGVAAKLRENIALNKLANVEVFPYALSDSEGTVEFNVPTEGAEAHGSMRANGSFAVAESIRVQTRRLDDVLEESGNPKIGLVKLDAEGAELAILRGASRLLSSVDKPCLIFEAYEENCRPFGNCVMDVLSYVQSFGYRLRQLDGEDWIAEA